MTAVKRRTDLARRMFRLEESCGFVVVIALLL
jgi:hypothetical protein